MRKIFTIVILALSINGFNQQWTNKEPMPTTRGGASAAVVNNIIYVIGGGNEKSILNTVEAYDPSTNTWTTKAPMSIARGEFATAAVNGKIYAIGGYNVSLGALNSVEEYNPATNTWTTKASMPTARSVISADVIDSKIYVVGGWPNNLSTLEVYDPSTNTWTTKASSSLGRLQTNGCAVLNNKLFFIGGKNNINTASYQINEAYDIISNTWTTYANLPQARNAGAASVLNNEIHYLGGRVGFSTADFNNHYVYNFSTNTWTDALPMLNKRSNHIAVTVNSRIYVIGGHSEDSSGKRVNWNEEYSPITLCDSILSWGLSLKDSVKLVSDVARICGNTATLDAGAGFASYSWNTGAKTQSISPIQSGFYKVTITTSNGCIASDSVYLSLVKAKIIQRDTTICKGASITLNVDSTIIGSTNSSLPPNLQSGLVAHYPFNGNANDVSGNGFNGTVFGATLSNDRFNKTSSAYSFNGISNYISTTDLDLDTEMTISVWVKPTSLIGALVDKNRDASTNSGYSFIYNNTPNGGVPRHGLYAQFGWSGNTANMIFPNPTVEVKNDLWHHCVLTYKSGTAKIYLDGIMIKNQTGLNPITQNNELMLMGKSVWNGNFFKGVLDDVLIYRRSLTDAEVFQLYNNQSVSWSTGATTNSITVTPTQTTKYYVTVSDGITSCRDSITVTVNDPTKFNPLSDTLRVCGDSVLLDAGSNVSNYMWNTGATTRTIVAKSSGKYTLTAKNAAGCISTDSSYVSLVKANIIQRDTTICKGSSITLNVDSTLIGSANSSLPPNLQSGLVAYYPFNGNANDESGNGNNGALSGAILSTDKFGNPNKAFSFNGSTDNISIPHKPILNFESQNAFTLSYWIKPVKLSLTRATVIISKQTGVGFSQKGWNSFIEPNAKTNFYIRNGTGQPYSGCNYGEISDNKWQHVVHSYNKGDAKVFIDGVLAGEFLSQLGVLGNTDAPILIGIASWVASNTTGYNGVLDDVSIYNRALTDAEVFQLYKNQSVSWSTGATTNSITVTPTQTTKYYVTVSDGITSCRDSITVTVNDPTEFNPLSDTLRICGDSVLLDAGSNVSNYMWNTGASTRTIVAKSSGKYTLTAKNAAGCISTDSSYVSLVKAKIIQRDTTICKGSSLNIELNSNSLKTDQWIRVSNQTDIYTRILKTNNGKYLAAARTNSRLYISDSLLNFVPLSSNLVSHNLSMGKDKLGNIYYGTLSQGIYKSIDNGMSWNYNVANGIGCGNLDFETDNQNNLYTSVAGYLRGLFVSKDAGVSWRNTFSGLDFMDIEFLSEYDKVFITSGDDPGGLWYSSSQGSVWTPIKDKPFSLNTIIIKSYAGKIFVFSTTGEVYVSNDGGTNWVLFSKIPIVATPTKYYNDAIFVDEKNIYVSLDKNGVFHSADNGVTWKLLSNGISGDPHYLYYETNTLLATTSNGIYKLNVFNDSTKAIWSTGATTNSITVTPTQTTKYYVTVSDGITSCRDSITVTVNSVDNSLTTLDPTTVCANSGSVRLQAGSASSYKWLKDGTVISGATSRIFSATQTGAYRVVVSNANGCTDSSRIVNITLIPPSVPGSISGAATVCSSTNSTTLTLSGNTGTIQWQSSANNVNFTNINGATAQTFTASNLTATTYYRAVVTNGSCIAITSSSTITVNPLPILSTSGIVSPLCFSPANQSTTLPYLSSNSPLSYSIDWSAAANQAGLLDQSTTAFVFAAGAGTVTGIVIPGNVAAGTYAGVMSITSSNGCVNISNISITINALPAVPVISAASNNFCIGSSLVLSTNGSSALQWYRNNVAITNATSSTLTVAQPGDYKVLSTGIGGCVSESLSKLIVENPIPVAGFALNNAVQCLDENRIITTNSSKISDGLMSYVWSFGDSSFSYALNPIHSYKKPGIYKVWLKVSGVGGCMDSVSKDVTINDAPVIPKVNTVGNTVLCEGGNVYLIADDQIKYQWYRNGVAIARDTSKVLKAEIGGIYQVRGSNAQGCFSGLSDALKVIVGAVPGVPEVKDLMYCINASSKPLTAKGSAANALLWYTPLTGDTAKLIAPVPSTSRIGTFEFFVSQRNAEGCEGEKVKLVVRVGSIVKKPEIKWDGGYLSTDAGYESYSWFADNNLVETNALGIHKPKIGGSYRVKVSNLFGCVDSSAVYMLVVTGVSNATVDNTMKMKVYPNPTQSKVWIDIGERPSKEVTLRLIDTKGRVVYQTKTKQQTTMINWSGMVSGTYIVEVVNGTSRRTMKVVKE